METSQELIFCQILDQDLHLTSEHKNHIILRHPEFKNFQFEFYETALLPDQVILRKTGEYLLVKWHRSIFNGKFVVIAVKVDKLRSWIITAYISRKKPLGELYE